MLLDSETSATCRNNMGVSFLPRGGRGKGKFGTTDVALQTGRGDVPARCVCCIGLSTESARSARIHSRPHPYRTAPAAAPKIPGGPTVRVASVARLPLT